MICQYGLWAIVSKTCKNVYIARFVLGEEAFFGGGQKDKEVKVCRRTRVAKRVPLY